jgi:predicted DNA binding CopG/RHH family protein
MAHGRNSTVISIRVSDSVYAMLKKDAGKLGLNIQDYIKKRLDILPDESNTKRNFWRSLFSRHS